MENKILIIVTRIGGTEFSNYWKFNNTKVDNNKIDYSKPIVIIIDSNHRVIIINGEFLPDVEYVENYLKTLFKLEDLHVNNRDTTGVISHSPDPLPISFIENNSSLAFNKKYSSSSHSGFCQYENSDFRALLAEPDIPRTGVFDAFRDAIVFSQNEKLSKTFMNLWNYFIGNSKLNAALEFLHNSLGGNPVDKNILSNGDNKFDFKKDYKGKSLEKWIEELDGKRDIEYILALANVRDALLNEAGATGEN